MIFRKSWQNYRFDPVQGSNLQKWKMGLIIWNVFPIDSNEFSSKTNFQGYPVLYLDELLLRKWWYDPSSTRFKWDPGPCLQHLPPKYQTLTDKQNLCLEYIPIVLCISQIPCILVKPGHPNWLSNMVPGAVLPTNPIWSKMTKSNMYAEKKLYQENCFIHHFWSSHA